MLKKPLTFILVLLSSTLLWCADYSDTQEKTFEVQGVPDLLLRNSDGVIEISTQEGSAVHVKVTKNIRGAKDDTSAKKEAEKISIELEQVGNQIRVITHWPHEGFSLGIGHHLSRDVKFEISTPVKSDVHAEVSDGELYISGIQGSQDLKTADGDISAKDLSGELRITASDGNIALKHSSGKMDIHLADGDLLSDGCSGSVRIQSGDGSVKLSGFDGEVEITNADGNINIDGILKSMNGKVSDGSMTVRVAPGSVMQDDWSLRAADGNITLDLPDDFNANVDISTSDGHVQTDHPVAVTGSLSTHHLIGKIREGGYILQIKTSDGDVAIK
jgi:hypothetical protein